MFDRTFEERLFERLCDVDDPTDIPAVTERVGDAISEISAMLNRVQDIENAWDSLEVTLGETGAEIKAYIHVEYPHWTNDIRIVMFSLLQDGFAYIAEKKAFEYELEVP